MNNYVSFDKLSKKERRKINNSRRVTWGDYGLQSPVTRKVENKKKVVNRVNSNSLLREY